MLSDITNRKIWMDGYLLLLIHHAKTTQSTDLKCCINIPHIPNELIGIRICQIVSCFFNTLRFCYLRVNYLAIYYETVFVCLKVKGVLQLIVRCCNKLIAQPNIVNYVLCVSKYTADSISSSQ